MKTIPHSDEAEKGVLSCMMQDERVLRKATTEVALAHFISPHRQTAFELLLALSDQGAPVDNVTLTQVARDRKVLDKIGGAAEIWDLMNFAPSPAHYDHYREILVEKWALRALLDVAASITTSAMNEDGAAKDLLEKADREFTAVHAELGNRRVQQTRSIQSLIAACVEEVEEWQNAKKLPGISTGFPIFDACQLQLRPSSYFVIAAPTSTGKSTLLAQVILNVIGQGKKVALASLEDSPEMFVHRMLSCRSKVAYHTMQKAKSMSRRDFERYLAAANQLAKEHLNILHNGGMTCDEFRHWARRQVFDFGADVVALDFIQRLKPSTKRGQNGEREAANEASATIKELSNDLGIPFLVCAQAGRLKGRKATRNDLKESGNIEEDCTELLTLQRKSDLSGFEEEEDHTPDGVARAIEVMAMVLKHKNGPLSEHLLYLFGDHFRFEAPARNKT